MRILPGRIFKPQSARIEAPRQQQRIRAVLDTVSGNRLAGVIDCARSFEDQARFGVAAPPQEGACLYLASEIERIMQTVSEEPARDGFLVLACPSVALGDGNSPIACDAAVRRSGLLHQEVCLEFPGSALEADSVARLARFKQAGFRLGLDVRKCGPVALDSALRVLIDTVRVDAREVINTSHYGAMLDAASHNGALVIAEHAHWRDGELLSALGVRGFIQPRADG